MTPETPVALPAVDQHADDQVDHPDDLTDAEAEAGLRVYQAVDDTDDESDGMDAVTR